MLNELLKMEIQSIDVNDVEFLDDIAEELAGGCGVGCGGACNTGVERS